MMVDVTEPLVPRMQGFGTTIFAEMSALAVRTGSINLGQGFPDTDGPAAMLEAARRAITDGHNQYPPGIGVPELRHAVARHQREQYGLDYDPDREVLVTVGATEAIAGAVVGLIEPGDEVIMIEPYYDAYAATAAMAGGVRRVVPLIPDGDGFRLDRERLADAFGPKSAVFMLNTPHNPTGTVLSDDDLAEIARLCIEFDVIVVADEVYEHLLFDGRTHTPIATLPGMKERTLRISSAAKTFNCTGWKVGWISGPPELVAATKTAKQYMSYVGSGPFQPAVAHALDNELGWVRPLGRRAAVQARHDHRRPPRRRFRRTPQRGNLFRLRRPPTPRRRRRHRVLPVPPGTHRRRRGPGQRVRRRPPTLAPPHPLRLRQTRRRHRRRRGAVAQAVTRSLSSELASAPHRSLSSELANTTPLLE